MCLFNRRQSVQVSMTIAAAALKKAQQIFGQRG